MRLFLAATLCLEWETRPLLHPLLPLPLVTASEMAAKAPTPLGCISMHSFLPQTQGPVRKSAQCLEQASELGGDLP